MESLPAFIIGFRMPEYLFTRKVLLHTSQQGIQHRDNEGGMQAMNENYEIMEVINLNQLSVVDNKVNRLRKQLLH